MYTCRIQEEKARSNNARWKELNSMRISISGKGIDISEYLRDLVNKKVSKLERYFPKDTEAQVTMTVEKNRHIVEVTIPYEHIIIRGEEVTGDMYASIDNVLDKLEKQIIRHRTRLEKNLKQSVMKQEADAVSFEEEDEQGPQIVRVKRFALKPMNEEEAMLQLALLGHSFYVFENADTGDVNVLYTRKDGNYGLIEPEN